MNYWSCELFEEDLKSKNYMQLADWLIACHEVVKRENYDTDEQYLDSLEAFCLEWEEHYNKDIEQNGKNSIYLSEKFKKGEGFGISFDGHSGHTKGLSQLFCRADTADAEAMATHCVDCPDTVRFDIHRYRCSSRRKAVYSGVCHVDCDGCDQHHGCPVLQKDL